MPALLHSIATLAASAIDLTYTSIVNMGKKKSKAQVFVLKPWCWYCEREFEDEKGKLSLFPDQDAADHPVLLQHQKSKHFKCTMCPRKLNVSSLYSIGGAQLTL